MNKLSPKIFLPLLVFLSLNCYSQNQENDSIEVTDITKKFFDWYMNNATEELNGECYPKYVKSKKNFPLIYLIYFFFLLHLKLLNGEKFLILLLTK